MPRWLPRMAEKRDFQDKQYAFAAHIRDPANTMAPSGIEDRRMDIYRTLFFNNLANLLGTFFPVLKKIHTKDQWQRLIREFMKRHHAKTPYFLQLPQEFVTFLEAELPRQDDDYPFLTELAHYEYAELALGVSDATDELGTINADGDLLTDVPVKSNLAWAYGYTYPVHRISATYLPEAPSDTPVFLALYRDSEDKVRFLELNAVTAALLDAIDNNERLLSGENLLRDLAAKTQYPDVDAMVEHGHKTLLEFRQLNILIGTRRDTT